MLARHLSGTEGATNLAVHIMKVLEPSLNIDGAIHHTGSGIGIALVPQEATTPEEAKRKADVALYRAKAEHRTALRFFEPSMDEQLQGRATLEAALRNAVKGRQIHARFTPSIELATGRPVGFQVVPYWTDGQGQVLAPLRFMSIAEETGLIHEVQEAMLDDACRAAKSWPADTRFTLELYPRQLKASDLSGRILGILRAHDIAPSRLELEIAESLVVQDLPAVQKALTPLRDAGVRVVVGRFGTGYSTLFHLRNFKVDRIKIDRSFAAGSGTENAAVVEALVGLGRGFGIEVSVDGISSEQQTETLQRQGCSQVQGLPFGEAISAEAAVQFFGTPHRGVVPGDDASVRRSA